MNQKSNQTKPTCRATKNDGTPCSATAQEGKNCCYFHDPGKAEERRAAQARGGQGNHSSSLPIDMPEFIAETVSDMRQLYQDTINQVRRGELSPKAATAICNLANGMTKTLEDLDLRRRLHNLEQQLLESNKKTGLFDPDEEQRNEK